MKILHCADWHLREKDIDECEKCLTFLVKTAETEAVDLVVIAGDVFHSQEIKLDSLSAKLSVKIVSTLATIAPVAIVIGTPSHDGKAPEILRYARGKYDVKVASMPEQCLLYQGSFYDHLIGNIEAEAVITLIPQPTKQFFQTAADISGSDQEIGQAMTGLFAGFGASATQYEAPHVLVGHFNVAGSTLSNGQVRTGMDIEVSKDQIALAHADAVCLGHIHLPQEFYSGSIYAVNVGEDHHHGFKIYDTSSNVDGSYWNCSVRFIPTPCKKIARFKFDMTAGEKITIPFDGLAGATVRIDVTAWQDECGVVDKKAMTENYLALGALSVDIHITAVPRENIRAEAVLNATALRDEIREMSLLRNEAISPEVLAMAERLEIVSAEQLLAEVAA